jgi:RNA polymerase sigma-70 factor (ECF subfamily)
MGRHDEPGSNGHWVRAAAARYQRPLVLYTARLVADADAARDIVQEAFLRLCAQDEREVAPRLPQWLYAVCRNRALDVKRKERRMSLLDDEQTELVSSETSNPLRIAERRDDATSIVALLGDLPANQQEAIRLKFQHELSYKQIAEVTQLSVSNVGFLIHTGLKTLRQRLNPERPNEQ